MCAFPCISMGQGGCSVSSAAARGSSGHNVAPGKTNQIRQSVPPGRRATGDKREERASSQTNANEELCIQGTRSSERKGGRISSRRGSLSQSRKESVRADRHSEGCLSNLLARPHCGAGSCGAPIRGRASKRRGHWYWPRCPAGQLRRPPFRVCPKRNPSG